MFKSAIHVITKDLRFIFWIVQSLVTGIVDEIDEVVVFFRRSHGDYERPTHR